MKILVFVLSMLCSTTVYADQYYIANLFPPDNFLAVRTAPTTDYGQRVDILHNGDVVDVITANPNGWWLIYNPATGSEGWAFSGYINRPWIVCCVR